MRALGKRRIGVFVAVASALALVGGGVAWATIPAANGTITACMLTNGTGAIRLIDPSVRHCLPTEKQLSWNVGGKSTAAFAKWNGSGGVNYKVLRNGVTTPLLTLPLPKGFASGNVVATATVWITNWLDEPVWGGCDVFSASGGGDGWPFTLTHGFNLVSFQVKVSGISGPLTLKCKLDAVGFLGNPAANGRVWGEVASLSAVPAATP